ncbi:MAG TPA: LacI family DNA-binding transcriptional regulator [Opitutaceae bacterium]|nr:LacI family DNA-binding transcriptional regulator [Opitutaceae bacterium]
MKRSASSSPDLHRMASLQEVARRAKVSIATVSRVLNQSDKVVPETRAVVEKALRELDYRPSRVARRLRMNAGRANLVGLIIPDIQNPFFAEIARGVEDAAFSADYALLLCNSDERRDKERFYLDVMLAESVDGIVLPPFDETDAALVDVIKGGMPVVCVDRSLTKVKTDLVEVDNYRGAFDMVTHLLDRGHKRIGLIEGRVHVSTSRERRRGYLDALAARGIAERPELTRAGDFRQESGHMLANELLDMRKPPTALFVCNNLMTVGALAAVHRRKLRVPDDVAVAGFDDVPWAEALDPPLSVVRQPAHEVGRQAMELLLRRIVEPARPPVTVRLMPELILRRST